jgi:hypothetical protein
MGRVREWEKGTRAENGEKQEKSIKKELWTSGGTLEKSRSIRVEGRGVLPDGRAGRMVPQKE